MKSLSLVLAVALTALGTNSTNAQSRSEDDVATLYRNSIFDDLPRIHIATFDSVEKSWGGTVADYNWENCLIAAQLFEEQPSVILRYWCETGFYRK
jgi:hypothetical protein